MLVETYISNTLENGSGFGYIVGGERDGDSVFIPGRVMPVKAGAGDIVELFTVTNRADPNGRSPWIAVGPLNGNYVSASLDDEEEEDEDEGREFTAQDVVDHVKAAERPLRVAQLYVVFNATTCDEQKRVQNAVMNAYIGAELTRVTVNRSGASQRASAVYYADTVETVCNFLETV